MNEKVELTGITNSELGGKFWTKLERHLDITEYYWFSFPKDQLLWEYKMLSGPLSIKNLNENE